MKIFLCGIRGPKTLTALAFNWMRQEGHPPPRPVEEKLQAYLLNLLRHDPTPQSFTRSMTATVRALALAALGLLALRLAQMTGLASPVWPAAGLAAG